MHLSSLLTRRLVLFSTTLVKNRKYSSKFKIMSERRKNRCGDTSPPNAILHVLGSGSRGSPKCVYFFTDNNRYLFNCGEGTQRLAHEYKLKLTRLDHIFVTCARWENTGGLPGTALTLQDVGIKNLTLHAPPGLDDLFVATQKFVVLNKLKIETPECADSAEYDDSTMSVKYVLLKSVEEKTSNEMLQLRTSDPNFKDILNESDDTDYYSHEDIIRNIRDTKMKDLLSEPKKENRHALAFVCRLKPRAGVLDLQKCVDRGIKPGPLLGVLKSGKDVTLPDGTVVYSKDVKTPDEPGPVFIVVDAPDENYLDSLLSSDGFRMHQEDNISNPDDIPSVIVHFTPKHVIQNEKYQYFIRSFPSKTQHLLVNDDNDCYGSVAIHRAQNLLHLLNKDMFPMIDIDRLDDRKPSDERLYDNCKTLTVFKIRPEFGLDRSNEIKFDVEEIIEEPYRNPEFKESLSELHKIVEDTVKTAPTIEYPKIIFFGTGSCIPNKTRNTSGIMVHIDDEHSVLFDCGEGTFGQMCRFYGKSQIDRILLNLKAIYVSHLHADHHIGLINILLQRRKALNKASKNDALYLLAPKQIMPWLCLYEKRFERILNEFTLVPNSDLINVDKSDLYDNMLKHLNLCEVSTCGVKHCPNAFGVAITTNDLKKITYSGDTMPCSSLVDLGAGSDILIHEATMEDDLSDEARRKFHSTTRQAVQIARQMEAKHTILTHFSQRYARVPRLSPEIETLFKTHNIGIAFDNMEIAYKNLTILPHLYPTLKLLFAEHCDDLENKAARRAMKRERAQSPKHVSIAPIKKQMDDCTVGDVK